MSARISTPIRSDPPAQTAGLAPGRAGDIAIARARLARFIAELFCEPDETCHTRLNMDAVRCEIEAAAKIVGLSAHVTARLFETMPGLEEVCEERGRLLGYTVRSACAPYELEYCGGEVFQQSQSLADIAGFYFAFGFENAGPLAERPDHVVPQWEFLSILAMKESCAIEAEEQSHAQQCQEAQGAFLKEHAASWMVAFFRRLRRAEPNGFFAHAAELAEEALREWCGALNVPAGPIWLELRAVTDEDSSMTCGAPGGAVVELGPTLAAAMDQQAAAPGGEPS